MKEKSQLLNIPIPFYDESLKGLIIRACMLNKIKFPLMYKFANLRSQNEPINVNDINETRLEKLGEILNIKADLLSSLTFHNAFKKCDIKIKNSIVYMGMFNGQTKICPKCLDECGYHRKLWDCKIYCVCPFHRCMLVENCQKCYRSIYTHRSNILKCECGFMYSEASVKTCEHEEVIEFSMMLHNKLFDQSRFIISKLYCLDHNLEFAQAIYLVMHFVKRISQILYKRNINFSYNSDFNNLHQIILKVICVFIDLPNSLHVLLDEIYQQPFKKKYPLHTSDLHFTVIRNLLMPEFKFILDPYQQYIDKVASKFDSM
ncbi:TniQ family protein [Paenibacillus sp. CGMCC 1.16610]|uniref:TniQ domain-containing protein n=1 Tax=Paenibacillus anseongense TaxID=2682845 RepID=A0ABW9UH27_9BACL|nr:MULTISPECIES: TniQ family protein [Paenibacillus]MBA2939824.1 TniQ family protein [Paenibacillus sp. CGMCC 1.16610]MVQ39484.1 hypothetical protein [Paenibacillus anseongense]